MNPLLSSEKRTLGSIKRLLGLEEGRTVASRYHNLLWLVRGSFGFKTGYI